MDETLEQVVFELQRLKQRGAPARKVETAPEEHIASIRACSAAGQYQRTVEPGRVARADCGRRPGIDIVADTSVIIAVIAGEPEKAALVAHTQGADLFAPRSLPWEIGNAFSAMLKRRRITLEQAKAAIKVYEQIPHTLVEIDLAQALEWADRLKIYAYDAYFIVCALNRNCPLLTLDSGLSYAATIAGVTVLEVK